MEENGAAMTVAGMITAGATAPGATAAEAPRIDLKVLVADNGDSPVKAVTAQLRSTGIPYTTVGLNDSRGIRHRGPWQTGLLGCLLRGVVFALPGLA
ncbi:hypothetical protein ABZ613_21430 [Streptomyces collinus]|uniref:hypothetical protein n=1 Tax=Streptomyces collinus TaxID=42684 RepID=UPI0033E7707D